MPDECWQFDNLLWVRGDDGVCNSNSLVEIDHLIARHHDLEFFAAALNPIARMHAFHLGPESRADRADYEGKMVDAIVVPTIAIGDHIVAGVLAIRGVATFEEGMGLGLRLPEVSLLSVRTFRADVDAQTWLETEVASVQPRKDAVPVLAMPPYD